MIRTVLALAAVLVLLGASPGQALTIKLATLAPEGSPWHTIIRDMAEEWKQISGGKVTVRIYPGGIAGDEADVVRKMRVGQLQAAVLSGEGLSRVAKDIQVLQLPLMLRSYAELDHVMATMGPKFEAQLEKKGFKVLSWGDAGWVRLFATRPLVNPDDRKGLKLFSWAGDPAFVEAWKEAGFQPVPLQLTELHTALQSGLVEGFSATPVAALSFQWFGLGKHMMDTKWLPIVGGTVISPRTWKKIPEEIRPQLLASARKAGERMKSETRRLDSEAIDAMKEYGLIVHKVPAKVVPEWEAIARGSYKQIVGTVVSPEVAAEVERLRDEYRKKSGG